MSPERESERETEPATGGKNREEDGGPSEKSLTLTTCTLIFHYYS